MSLERCPSVSVIVCAYNGEKCIHSCLSGITAQTFPSDRYEVLIIDDESTDSTFDIVSDFINNQENDALNMWLVRIQHGGLSVARNSGIQLSKEEIIAFIDQDAIPDSTWLEELVKPFLAGADYVGGRINLLNTDSWVARFLQSSLNRQFFGPRIFNNECIGCNMAYRREVFRTVGGFHENFVSYGDETTLKNRIRERFQFSPALDAVVLHKRPDTIAAALSVTWKSATLVSLAARASKKRMHLKAALSVIEQFLLTLFPVLLCIVWFSFPLFLIPLIVTFIAVIRRLYLRPLNRAIAIGMVKDYGVINGTVGFTLFCFTLNILGFWGWFVSPWLHRNVRIIRPMTSKLIVLKSVEKDRSI